MPDLILVAIIFGAIMVGVTLTLKEIEKKGDSSGEQSNDDDDSGSSGGSDDGSGSGGSDD